MPKNASSCIGFQCGAPSPAKARHHIHSVRFAYLGGKGFYFSWRRIRCNPSRSHCTTAPAIKILPSSAYSTRLFIFQAMVVSRLFLESNGICSGIHQHKTARSISVFHHPGCVHNCPKSAACWSPAMPAMAILEDGAIMGHCAIDFAGGFHFWQDSWGISNSFNKSSSHWQL